MPDKNPFAPSSSLAFLTGLTGSLSGYMKDQGDRVRHEDEQKRKTDYELLMAALEHMKPDLTPSQAKEILTRAVDINKPKQANSIKERIGELFGTGPRYEPQAGKILNEMPKPKVDVGTVGGGDRSPIVMGDVTLPPPPEMPYRVQEKTYRQQELADREQLIGAQTEKVLATEERRQENRLELQEQRNKDIIGRVRELYKYKTDLDAEKDLLKRAALYDPSNPRNPEAMMRAAQDLQQEADIKRQWGQSRIEYNKKRLEQIDRTISQAEQRINLAKTRLSAGKQANWNNDPQVKGAWAKVAQYKESAKTLRTQAAIAYSKGDDEVAEDLNKQAEIAETTLQGVIDNIEERINYLNERGGVSLPNPPGKGGKSVKMSAIRARAAKEGLSPEQLIQALPKGTTVLHDQ